jgi:hypothetical protein
MTEIVILVSPSFDHRDKRRNDRFDARLKDTDEVICMATRQPVLDASRVLLGRGHDPSTKICMAYAHAPTAITSWAIIGAAAQYDVMGEKFVRRKTTAGAYAGLTDRNRGVGWAEGAFHARTMNGLQAGPYCIRATFMVLRWDCDATFAAFTVPPQGHYSIYHVGMSCGRLCLIRSRR